MDENLQILLVVVAVAIPVGCVGAVMMSTRVREFGLLGALRRAFSGGEGRSQYRH